MKHLDISFKAMFFFVAFTACGLTASAQLTGTKNVPGDYASLDLAIQDLNVQGVGPGGVVINLLQPETAPAGGYVINTLSGTAANQITLVGNANTVTASASQTAGSLNDAIFKIIGSDYVSIIQFTLRENPLNTVATPTGSNTMTEFAVALFYASTTEGAQNNSIVGNTITLDRTYTNTFGIYSNVRHSPTSMTTAADPPAFSGSNSFNKVYGNTISNVNYGIVFIGANSDAPMDRGNDIGGTSALTGNSVTNFGTAGAATGYVSLTGSNYAIFMNQQLNNNVSFNTIVSATHAATNTLGGILQNFSVAAPTSPTTTTLNNNVVTLTKSAASGVVVGVNYQGITVANPASTVSMNNNQVMNCSVTGATALTAVTNLAAVGVLNMNNNITFGNTSSATTGGFTGVSNSGAVSTTINMNGNQIGNASGPAVTYSVATTGQVAGIINTGAAAGTTVNMNANSLSGFVMVSMSTGNFFGIVNAGAAGVAVNINNNSLGNATTGLVSYSGAPSCGVNPINTQGGTATTVVTIMGNDIRGINHAVAATSAHIYISASTATLSQNISSNTFTDLNVNTTGSVTFISNNVSLSATGSATVNNNSIVTGFSKTGAGGTVSIYLSNTALSVPGATKTATNNNFSNITLTGATVMAGWMDTEGSAGGGATKTISNNVFSNWTCGTSAVNVIQTNLGGDNTILNGNVISNISVTSAGLTGISIGSGNAGATQTVSNNTITGLTTNGASGLILGITSSPTGVANMFFSGNTLSGFSSAGSSNAVGFSITQGSTIHVLKNKIGDIQSNGGNATGISVSAGGTANITNNLIGDLRTLNGGAVNALNGITLTALSTANVYYNSIYLNNTSTGANFGSSGINANTPIALDLRNNLIVNTSTPNGTGLTVAFRRNNTTLTTYQNTSDNNAFYAGTPSANHLIFYDGTNSDQTLAAFQARVAPRDAASVSENPTFSSLSVSSPAFLHIPFATVSQLESGGGVIASYTTDYDNDSRPGPVGSVNGGALAPDIGADEFDGFLTCSGAVGGTVTPSAVSICNGSTTVMSSTGASSGAGITYQWMVSSTSGGPYTNVVGGAGATTTTYTTGALAAGVYYYVLEVTCSSGPTTALSNELTVTVHADPVVTANSTASTVCSGGSVTLTGGGAGTYAWTGGVNDGVAFVPATTDTYTVTGTDGNGCTNTATITVTVNPLPTVNANTTASAVCSGNSVTLTGSGATSYGWTGGVQDGVPFVPVSTDTYTVTGTDGNGCSNTDEITVTVNALPTVTASSTAAAVCAGGSVTLTGGGAGAYVWTGGVTDGVAFVPVSTDTYTVTGTDGNGCSNTAVTTVTVNALPTVAANSTAAAVCAGDSVTLTGAGAASYTWTGSVTDGVPFAPAVTDTYTVTGTDGNNCSATATITVTVNALPTVTVNLPLDTVCLNGGSVTLSGESPAGGVWSGTGVTGNTLDPLVPGIGYNVITYTFTDANGCSASYSDSVWIDLCSGVNTIAAGSSFEAYPNPNNGMFTVMIPDLSGDAVLEVTDAIGQLVYSENLSAPGNALVKQIDLGAHPSGIYFVRFTANGASTVKKVVIQR